jgi:uncharacterized membrane protein YgdD (TMEM256/DUF423 family)
MKQKMNKSIVIIGVLMLVIAIILGAFGAHALKEHLTPEKLNTFEVGVRYQIYHGLAFLILGLSADKILFSLKSPIRLIFAGVLLFSCSIYFLAIQEMLDVSLKFLGPVTPLGGVLIISGWILFLVKVIRSKA